jgi:hypothetical protein
VKGTRNKWAEGQVWLVLASLASCPLVALAQETSLTIHADGYVTVRRANAQPVARGASTVAVDPGTLQLDPASIVLADDGAELRGTRLVQAVGADAALRRAVGRDIDFWVQLRDTAYFVRGRVLSLQPPAVRVDGRVLFSLPGQPAFPESLVQFAPRLELSVTAARALPALRYAYVTQGLQWQASYAMVVPRVGGGPATVTGTASIQNSGLTARGAEVQLAAGTINRAMPRPMMRARAGGIVAAPVVAMEQARSDVATEESVGEVRVYALPGRVDLEPGVITTAALFAPAQAEVAREFRFDPVMNPVEQWMAADSGRHPEVSYRLTRAAGTPFGETPLPAGAVRVLAPDTDGRMQVLGEASLGHTPRGRDVIVSTGTAFDVTADRVQTAFERRGERDATVAYRMTIRNGKDESITAVVREDFPGRWEVLNSTVAPERVSSSTVRFAVPVPARTDVVLEYRVRARW